MPIDVDFDTGKLHTVVKTNCRAEYALLGAVLLITLIPYIALFWLHPLAGLGIVLGIAIFQMVVAFSSSARGGLSHHVRFLLAGSNPIGMSGGASLLLGGVDSIFDWQEDAGFRRKSPLQFWWTTALKFLTTPLGVVLMVLEYLWDLVLLRRGSRLVKCKWQEFFSLARYHSFICPEKSNDIFYADLAFAKYCDNVFLYQWNRMRAMVFELQQYKLDIEAGVGGNESNLFRVGDMAAYQILKRLEIERLEQALTRHFHETPADFPIPEKLAARLVANARPLTHYLRMRQALLDDGLLPTAQTEMGMAFRELVPARLAWQVLRLLDGAPAAIDHDTCCHISQRDVNELAAAGVLAKDDGGYQFDAGFLAEFEGLLAAHCAAASDEQAEAQRRAKVPSLIEYRGRRYVCFLMDSSS